MIQHWTSTRIRSVVVGIALAVSAFSNASHAEQPKDPVFMKFVYPPELIMRHASEIELSREQRKAITAAVTETQASTVELSWDMQDAAKRLGGLITKDAVDIDAAMEAATLVMETEVKVKKRHMRLLITLKNILDPKQQEKLQRLRENEGD